MEGYLLHADADTWMDVKHEVPASPRGNRANDFQWLWYRKLMAGVGLARLMNNSDGTPDKQYPWGVASLEQHDGQFHPYHHWDEKYHFDDAYHNGTVWLWLNGIFMQRMIEYGEVETAWLLFSNMNRTAPDTC